MSTAQEIRDRINQRTSEIQARAGAITGTQVGTEGRDRLFGSFENDSLSGLGGDDFISGNLGDDFLDGGSGSDDVIGGLGTDYLLGGDGNDRVVAGLGDDIAFGNGGNDNLDGSLGGDVLFGGDGNDTINGGGNGDPNGPEEFFLDFVVGGAGSDTLRGTSGGTSVERDFLVGGGTVDANGFVTSFAGDGARDIFVLGSGDGSFYANAGEQDFARILGFENGVDQLQLSPVINYSFGTNAAGDTLVVANLPSGGSDLVAIIEGVQVTGLG